MNNVIIGRTIDNIYVDLLKQLMGKPDYIVKPRDIKTIELINTTLTLTNPRFRIITHPIRKMSKRYFAGELCFYLSKSDRLKDIAHYASFWNKISDDGETVNSAYGKKLFGLVNRWGDTQWEYARSQLQQDPTTRKAIALIYTPDSAKFDSKDNPCTIYLHFLIRNWSLQLHVYMRSNDAWLGVPYDVAFFSFLQELMLAELKMTNGHFEDVTLGSYYHHSGSLHLYEQDFAKVNALLLHGHHSSTEGGWMHAITKDTCFNIENLLKYERAVRGIYKSHLIDTELGKDNCILQIASWLNEEEEK